MNHSDAIAALAASQAGQALAQAREVPAQLPTQARESAAPAADSLRLACPACEGQGFAVGAAAGRLHYCCRDCGVNFSHALAAARGA